MKRHFASSIRSWGLLFLAVVVLGACSCTGATESSPPGQATATESSPVSPPFTSFAVNESIVQVRDAGVLAATGVVIGDGSQVLTVLDYEVSVPDSLDIVTAGGEIYPASIQAIDPRTGATLLKVEATGLPVATVGDAASLAAEQTLVARWYQQLYIEGSLGEPELQEAELAAVPDTPSAPVNFGVHFPPGSIPDIPSIGQGAVITDEQGAVAGLLGVDYNTIFTHPHGLGILPPIASINVALELLAPDFADRPYADGPLMIAIDNGEGTAFFLSYFPNYDAVTVALEEIYGRLDTPLAAEELPQDYHPLTVVGPAECSTATVVYALPVEITSADGTPLARAKWVSIQWNRADGAPNLLYYGSGRWNLEGGFQLPDDLSDLMTAIDPLVNYLPGR
ncbi:MAG: trypsin-like peptidase domain-containing protein [Dehalococcoidales bacterium]|nr:trypsin-like peptidase domain-containing protein [Dehalococcoidales bacterium]